MLDTHDYRADALNWLDQQIEGCTAAIKTLQFRADAPWNSNAPQEIRRNGMLRSGYVILRNTLAGDDDLEPWELAERRTLEIITAASTLHQGTPPTRYDIMKRKADALFILKWRTQHRD